MKQKFSYIIITIALMFIVACLGTSEKSSNSEKEESRGVSTINDETKSKEETKQDINITNESGIGKYSFIPEVKKINDDYYVVADFIQFLYGEEAIEAAKKRGSAYVDIDKNGDTTYSVTDDYIILNENPKLRTFRISKSAYIRLFKGLQPVGNCNPSEIETGSDYPPYLLSFKNGVLDTLYQVYIP